MIDKLKYVRNRVMKNQRFLPLIERGIETQHPFRDLFVEASLNHAHFSIKDEGSDDRKDMLKLAINSYNAKNYERALEIIRAEKFENIDPLEIRLFLQLKMWNEIIARAVKGRDVISLLTEVEQRRLIQALVKENLFFEADFLLHYTAIQNHLLKEYVVEMLRQASTTQILGNVKSHLYSDFEQHPETLLNCIETENRPHRERDYLSLLNEYKGNDQYMKLLVARLSGYMEEHTYLYKYVEKAIPEHMDLLGDWTADTYKLVCYLRDYKLYNKKGSEELSGRLERYLGEYEVHSTLIVESRKLIERIPQLLDTSHLYQLLVEYRSLTRIFASPQFFLKEGLRDIVDQFIHSAYRYRDKKRIYNQIIPLIVEYLGEIRLPLHFYRYLIKTKAKKIQNYYILSRYYMDSSDWTNLESLLNEKDEKIKLKIWLYLSRIYYQNNDIEKSLQCTKEAEAISPDHPDVIRNYIRNHGFQGNVTAKNLYVHKMYRHHPKKLLKKELEHSNQELHLLHYNWTFSHAPKAAKAQVQDKVMFVLNKAYPAINGYTVRSHEMIKRMKHIGVEPVVVTKLGWHPEDEGYALSPVEEGLPKTHYIGKASEYPVTQTPLMDYFDAYADTLKKLILKERPSVIHAASNFQNALPALEAGNALKIKTVYEVRGLWHYTHVTKNKAFFKSERFKLEERQELRCCEIADEVICISESLRNYLMEKGIDEKKITVLPNGVDTRHLRPEPETAPLKKALGINKEDYVVGFVGSLTNYEGIELLMDSIKEINCNQLSDKCLKLLIIGGGYYETVLKGYAKTQGMEKEVIFTGRISREEVASHYSLIDLAPFPRTNEMVCHLVTPLKTYEAMAMEKTVMVSDVSALKEMVEPGINGFMFEAESRESLIEGILSAMRNEDIGKSAREWVKEFREWDKLITILKEVYN